MTDLDGFPFRMVPRRWVAVVWERANPAYAIRACSEDIAPQGGNRSFTVERLGLGNWPTTEERDDDAGA